MSLFDDDKPKVRKPRPKDTVFEKAVELFYPYGIPRQTRKKMNSFIKDLHDLKATPELMQERYDQIAVNWPTITPTLGMLTNRWNELEPKDAKAKRLHIARREQRLGECRAHGKHLKIRWRTQTGVPHTDQPTPWHCYHCGAEGEHKVKD